MEVYITRAHNISNEKSDTGKAAPPERFAFENFVSEGFLEEIYCMYYKSIYNYISFRINNHHDTEELTNTVFEKAVRGLLSYKPELSPVEAWLIGIAKNTVTDYLRGKKRRVFVSPDFLKDRAAPGGGPDDICVAKEENRALIKAMSKLKDKERQILSMKFATDLKNTEIARILEISESNVGVIIHRSVKRLKKILEAEGGAHERESGFRVYQ